MGAQLFHQHTMPLFPETSAVLGTLALSLSLLLYLICLLFPPSLCAQAPYSCQVVCNLLHSMCSFL